MTCLTAFMVIPMFAADNAGQKLTALKVFSNLPEKILDMVSPSSRIYMTSYWSERDSIYTAKNALDGNTRFTKVTDNYLKVQLSDVSTFEIKLLSTTKGDTIVATSYTVCSDQAAADSRLQFFNSKLETIPTKKIITLPKLKNFFKIPKGSQTTIKEIEQTIPFETIEYTLLPDSDTLTAKLTASKYLSSDDYNIIHLFEIPQIDYIWNGKKFILDKMAITNKE